MTDPDPSLSEDGNARKHAKFVRTALEKAADALRTVVATAGVPVKVKAKAKRALRVINGESE